MLLHPVIHLFAVMEYIPRGELFAAWKHCECFSENLVKIYIAELALVIDFLHRAGIIYRDLKVKSSQSCIPHWYFRFRFLRNGDKLCLFLLTVYKEFVVTTVICKCMKFYKKYIFLLLSFADGEYTN